MLARRLSIVRLSYTLEFPVFPTGTVRPVYMP